MSAHIHKLESVLDRFSKARHRPEGAYEWSHHHDGGVHDTHLVFSSLIHGNEVGPLEGLVRIVEALSDGSLRFGGRVTLFVGNPEAARADQRFLEADLNRVFGPIATGQTHEERRARELMPLLDQGDVYIDFHQTLKATRSEFYIFPWSVTAGLWVRALAGAEVWVTRNPGQAFSPGMMCADEYARAQGKPGITLELGEKGWREEAAATAHRVMKDALSLADDIVAGTRTLREAAEAQPAVTFVETAVRQRFTDPKMALREGLMNFDPVEEGDVLSAPGTPELRASQSGALLFPKYPPRDSKGSALDPRPKEIYRIVAPVSGDPETLWAE